MATYELLIGLFAVAFANRLGCAEDWADLLDAPPTPAELKEALAPLAPYLVLDGDGPRFAQDLAELSGEVRPPDALLLDSPGDNTVKNGAICSPSAAGSPFCRARPPPSRFGCPSTGDFPASRAFPASPRSA